MNLALDLVQNGNSSRATVHAESPADLFGEFASKVPPSTPNFGFINLDRSMELEKGQYFGVHVVMACLAKQKKLLLKGVAPAAHVASHFRSCATDPHSE